MQRAEFSRILLLGVLSSVRQAGLLSLTFVVSSDGKVLEEAKRLGAKTVPEPSDEGVNSAVHRGLAMTGGGDALIIPADLPMLKPSDLRYVVSLRSSGLDVVISPSRAFDGTNALLISADTKFALRYDDNSFWNHIAGAGSSKLSLGVCTRHGLMFDVDTPEDLESLAGFHGNNRAARFAKKIVP
jgi:2-phospho-L-lactate guanylyltransferase